MIVHPPPSSQQAAVPIPRNLVQQQALLLASVVQDVGHARGGVERLEPDQVPAPEEGECTTQRM